MIRTAIAFGIDPIDAFRAATLNPAEYFHLHDRGAIAPGRWADLFIFDDLKAPTAREVFIAGKSVREYRSAPSISNIPNSIHVDFEKVDLQIPARGRRIRAIGSLPNQLLTDHRILDAKIENGLAVADPQRDILKMAVIERHRNTGNVGLGFIQGFGLKRGAIAGTVAHDHHNLVVIGADDESMLTAARAAAQNGGGLAVAEGPKILARLPLPVAGLMSDCPIQEVRLAYDALLSTAASLGSILPDPFMAMSFMALEVIPALKLTDQGLVDVEKFTKVDLFV
jgi:adenine deaminase